MEDFPALLGILAAISIGAVSPGPSFVMVARTAVSSSRIDGVCAAIGMGIGGLLFAVAALLGLHGLLLAVPSLYVGLKVIGGLYLGFLGLRIWRSAKQQLVFAGGGSRGDNSTAARSFLYGLITQLSNPKAAIINEVVQRRVAGVMKTDVRLQDIPDFCVWHIDRRQVMRHRCTRRIARGLVHHKTGSHRDSQN